MKNMKLFAIDLGNRQVKLKSEKATKVLPSYYVDVAEYGKRNVLELVKSEEAPTTGDYKSGRDEGFTYVWGTGLDVSRKHVTDTLGLSKRYDSREFKVLADLALAELARDFKESLDGILDVVVVTGVPTNEYDDEDTFKHIKEALTDVRSATIDGVTYVVRVHEVYILMQPVGTAIDVMVDEIGDIIDGNDIEDGYVGIVDIGGGTIIIDAFEKMNLDTNNRVQLEDGSHKLFINIRNRINDDKHGHRITEHEVERIVRDGHAKQSYYWSPNGRDNINITDIVKQERERYTRKVVQSVKSTFKSMSRMRKIYVTGGTANLLNQSEFKTAIPIAEFVKDSETANVRGYYKYGLLNEVNVVDESDTIKN